VKLSPRDTALVAGVIAGGLAYYLSRKNVPTCGQETPANAPSFLDSVLGALEHPAEDFSLGVAAFSDFATRVETLGLVAPTSSADLYAWWQGLTDAQRQAVENDETAKNLICAAMQTGAQVFTAGESLMLGAAVGLGAFFLVKELQL